MHEGWRRDAVVFSRVAQKVILDTHLGEQTALLYHRITRKG